MALIRNGALARDSFKNAVGGRLDNCDIHSAVASGGEGVEVENASVTIVDCTIHDNYDDGVVLRTGGSATISGTRMPSS